MASGTAACVLLMLLVLLQCTARCHARSAPGPLYRAGERGPLAAVGELLPARLQEPRLPLPALPPQNLDTIKKIAQILIVLGEQVIPAAIGEPPARAGVAPSPATLSPLT